MSQPYSFTGDRIGPLPAAVPVDGANQILVMRVDDEPDVVTWPASAGNRHAASPAASTTFSDEALVAGVRARDARAFEVIDQRYRRALERYATRLLGGRRDVAEDVVQESLWRAHQALSTRDARILLRPWLYRIVRNRAVDALRSERPAADVDAISGVVSPEDPHVTAVLREQLQDMMADIASLPERQRTALVSHVVDGNPYATVAAEMDLTLPASKALVHRAQDSLRRTARLRQRAEGSLVLRPELSG